MATIKAKYYTVRINDHAFKDPRGLWYKNKTGEDFKTVLAIGENSKGTVVPVFKCIESPFYHVYPNHCTIVKEEIIEV